MYLANPNNPTGTVFTRQEFDQFYRHVPERVLIILDEAYFDYARDNPSVSGFDALSLSQRDYVANVLEGLWTRGSSHWVRVRPRAADRNVLKVKLPFKPSTLAQAATIAALADKAFLHKSLELNGRTLHRHTHCNLWG